MKKENKQIDYDPDKARFRQFLTLSKKYLYLSIPIVFLIVAIIWFYKTPPTNSILYGKRFYKSEYCGVVTQMYIDIDDYHAEIIKIKMMDSVIRRVTSPKSNTDLYKFVDYGDTITKHRNTNSFIIRGERNDTVIYYELKYPCSEKKKRMIYTWFLCN